MNKTTSSAQKTLLKQYAEQARLEEMGYREHHTSLAKGYFHRANSSIYPGGQVWVCEYSGKFGKGYVIEYPAYHTNNYHWKKYMIK